MNIDARRWFLTAALTGTMLTIPAAFAFGQGYGYDSQQVRNDRERLERDMHRYGSNSRQVRNDEQRLRRDRERYDRRGDNNGRWGNGNGGGWFHRHHRWNRHDD